MKNAFSFVLTAAAVIASGMLTATPAAAQAFTAAAQGTSCDPQKTNTSGAYTSTPASAFSQVTCSSSGLSVTLQAWAAYTTAQTGFVRGNLGDFNSNGFGAYTGINETNAGSQHAFDNMTSGCGTTSNAGNSYSGATTAGGGVAALTLPAALASNNSGCGGAVEALLLNFGTAKVKLSQVSTGFAGTDADLSLYVWTGGAGGPTMTSQAITNNDVSGLAGWTLVGSNDMGPPAVAWNVTDTNVAVANTNQLYSSYFLVTTYFGAASASTNTGAGIDATSNDSFKINGWTANVCAGTVNASGVCSTNVPEPGSLALAGLAMFGMFASRRKARALF